jgi:hypothetical protein
MASSPAPTDSQDAVFKLLTDPTTFDGADIRRIDTHGASVFLAGDRVIKVKRAVHYPYLDYSTLDKREAACRAELSINRNFAPQLYRRVVPITREPSEHSSLTATAHRSNGRSRWPASTRIIRSTASPIAANSATPLSPNSPVPSR